MPRDTPGGPSHPTTPTNHPKRGTHLGKPGVGGSEQQLRAAGGACLAELLKPLRFMFFLSDPFGSKSAVDELRPQPLIF